MNDVTRIKSIKQREFPFFGFFDELVKKTQCMFVQLPDIGPMGIETIPASRIGAIERPGPINRKTAYSELGYEY